MHKGFKRYWNKVELLMRGSLLLSVLVSALSILLLLLGILALLHISWQLQFALPTFLILCPLLFLWSDFRRLKRSNIINYLHLQFPDLEYSLGLHFDTKKSEVANIQREKIAEKLPPLNKIPLPEKWKSLLLLLVASVVVFYIGLRSQMEEQVAQNQPLHIELKNDELALSPNELVGPSKGELTLTVQPPAYTGLQQFNWQQGELVPEGSNIQFTVSQSNMQPQLILQGTDTLSFLKEKRDNKWQLNRQLKYTTAFQTLFLSKDTTIEEPIKVLEVLNDHKPTIRFALTETRVELRWNELNRKFPVPLEMKDDYGLSAANVVATLSKGDGESVKFREMKWPLPGFNKARKIQSFTYSLKLDTLGLDPGDELYFFIEVVDNKAPVPQRTKSEVFFIEVQDTIVQESVAFEGLALSTEPEYFKSQRQIIIDTEKLLKEKNSISQSSFEEKSNAIGADQKILRLRYGIFLGEEYEVSGGLGEIARGSKEEPGHAHDDHGEEEHDPDDPTLDHSGHDHGSEKIGAQPGQTNFSNALYNTPEMEAYVHAHDNSEIATFFDAEVKKKLKEALANMWEAELYLRTYRPKQALPYEYKALELIKEVQRASRIYVERMGFEPPPLEPDKKRLTGKLDKINAKTTTFEAEHDEFLEALQSVHAEMQTVEYSSQTKRKLELIQQLSELLVRQMVDSPARYAKILASISTFRQNQSLQSFQNVIVMTEVILPESAQKIAPEAASGLRLQEVFHHQLNNE